MRTPLPFGHLPQGGEFVAVLTRVGMNHFWFHIDVLTMIFVIYLITMICKIPNHGHPLILKIMVKFVVMHSFELQTLRAEVDE